MSFIKKVDLIYCLFAIFFNTSIHAINYYINDNDIGPNVWCSAPGNDLNNGTSPATPKLTFANLFSSYTLISNDIVYVDTGVYNESVQLPSTCHGAPEKYLVFQGAGINNQISLVKGSGSYSPFYLNNIKWVKIHGFQLDTSLMINSGVWLNLCTNVKIIKNSIISNNYAGILSFYSPNTLIISNIVNANASGGISIQNSESISNIVMQNICKKNGYSGIDVSGSKATLYGNTIISNGYYGIYGLNSRGHSIMGNIIGLNGRNGILLSYTSNTSVVSNSISKNSLEGILVTAGYSNTFRKNCITNNINCGIKLQSGSSCNTIIDNIVYLNMTGFPQSGILLDSTVYSNHVINNYIQQNSRGIEIQGFNNIISSNTCLETYSGKDASIYDNGGHHNIFEYNYCRNGGTWGVFVIANNSHNEIIQYNRCYKSVRGGIRIEGGGGTCNHLMIRGNICASNAMSVAGNGQGGIVADYWNHSPSPVNLTSSTLINNICYDNGMFSGIHLYNANNCVITSNILYNQFSGNGIASYYSANLAFSFNKCYSNSYGAWIDNCTSMTMYRSLFFENGQWGMRFNNSGNLMIKNCDIIHNRLGITIQNQTADNAIKNSIVAWNNTTGPAWGLDIENPGSHNNTFSYNDIFGHSSSTDSSTADSGGYAGNYNGCSAGIGDFSPSLDPIFVSADSIDNPQFLHLSNMSPCIDTGDPADDSDPLRQGSHIDRGAYESPYSVSLTLSKVASVTLHHAPSDPIPGAKVYYEIRYHNSGTGAALKAEIIDILPLNMGYIPGSITTDSIHTGGSVVVNCYDGSTWQTLSWGNANPVQIKKIRWRISSKTSVGPETGSGTYPNTDSGIVAYQLYIK